MIEKQRTILSTATENISPSSPSPPEHAFTLLAGPDENTSLRSYRGQPVILVFHPPDWRPTHDDQVVLYPEIPTRPHGYHAQVASMPVNGIRNHFAFTPDRKIQLSALSDFGLRGAAARTYGAHCHQDGTSERTHYLTDTKCIIRWSYVSPLNVNPGMDGILTPLEGLNT